MVRIGRPKVSVSSVRVRRGMLCLVACLVLWPMAAGAKPPNKKECRSEGSWTRKQVEYLTKRADGYHGRVREGGKSRESHGGSDGMLSLEEAARFIHDHKRSFRGGQRRYPKLRSVRKLKGVEEIIALLRASYDANGDGYITLGDRDDQEDDDLNGDGVLTCGDMTTGRVMSLF